MMRLSIKNPNTNEWLEIKGFKEDECVERNVDKKVKELEDEVRKQINNGFYLSMYTYSRSYHVFVRDQRKRLDEEFLGSACVISMDEMDALINKVKELV